MGAYGLWLTSLLFASGIGISALPTENFSNGVLLDDIDTLYNPHANHSKRADDFYLRPLALGASITWGLTSSDGNGYRKHLRDGKFNEHLRTLERQHAKFSETQLFDMMAGE